MSQRLTRRALALRLVLAFLFRYACFAIMVALTLWNEQRPGPRLHDRVLEAVPYIQLVDRWNYWAWLLCYVPLSLMLLARAPRRAVRFLVAGGLLSLVRGVCVCLTGLGPVRPEEVGLNPDLPADAWLQDLPKIVNPLKVFFDGSAHTHLTQDLYFSGHVATTFLLLLFCWPVRGLRGLAIAAHVITVACVFTSHLHYAIDVVGAWTITFCLFHALEGRREQGEADHWTPAPTPSAPLS